MWKSRWPSWAPRPHQPYGFRGRKAILKHASALVSASPYYVNRHPRTLSNTTEPGGKRGGGGGGVAQWLERRTRD